MPCPCIPYSRNICIRIRFVIFQQRVFREKVADGRTDSIAVTFYSEIVGRRSRCLRKHSPPSQGQQRRRLSFCHYIIYI